MDFTFIMFVLSCGALIGSYFIYWHIENVITNQSISLMHDIESFFSGWRSLLREDLDTIKESLEIIKNDCGKVKESVIEEVKKQNDATTYKPARKTSMKLKEKSSSDDGD